MNYAEKELRESMAYLDQARETEEALKQIARALDRGEPVQITFASARATATDLCPEKAGSKILEKLMVRAAARVKELEKQEVYWCEEVAHLDKQTQLNEQRRKSALDEQRRTNPPEGVMPLPAHPNAPREQIQA